MEKTLERLFARNTKLRRLLILLILVVLGIIDLATGYEYSFSVFYLLPISIAAWYDQYKTTVITILLSAITWLIADSNAGHPYSNSIIPFWNALVRLGFFSIVAFLLINVRKNWQEMKNLAMKDQLTSLDNSRAFDIEYRILRKLNFRKQTCFAVGIIDLDGFKAVNDTHGHHRGDEVLLQFSQVLKKACRSSDIIARLGGDEFAIILLDIDETQAHHCDQRIRALFQESDLKQKYGVDFSMGLAILAELPENLEDATKIADQLMYQSKSLGKSQTTIQTFI
ncbi:GGDEF domain-containing protein [Acinetobacter sp. VNH17]|uniref:diguanylate cyclase n=1 Tax=Acinetobacter thutiue TaxID=2998078 RepID=A0ABT7WLM8_9GAMM|nr:GGDEF domain-containing protein [Acinetobacter thutiue]MCY6411473.1 GGDEF domain-containing protein [Acinetobacter thutiue]MDN0013575.1 GGDEF domain-containing protein [Acinetobacter thutiue]